MRILPLLLLLTAVLTAAPSKPADRIVLADHGKSAYSICISRNASPSEKHGAQELQKFLQGMSGARLPIVTDDQKTRGKLILVGDSRALRRLKLNIPFGQLGAEGFVLKTHGDYLVIAGGRLRGTMYGVYTFLDKLGCRWFTRDVSRIPRMTTIAAGPLDETEKPAFEYREPFFTEAFDTDWAARNRMNGAHMALNASTGGRVEYYPFVHTFYEIIPPAKYFKDHPEYFALVDGKRRDERAQLCLTNPDVLRITVQTVLHWIAEHPDAKIISVSQNDSTGWCECDKCRRVEQEEGGVHSGPILRFVNAVAAEVAKKYPDKLIDTLAYWYSEDPPLHVRPLPNVRIRLCPIGACEAHPYEQCPRDAYFMKNLRAWSKITNQLYIWHYNTDFAHYLMPFPDFDELAADIPMYQRHGVVGLFMEGDAAGGGGGENAELRSYVMARLLWNPDIDVNGTIDEFLDAVYGKAAQPMRAYFDLLHRQVRLPPAGLGHHLYIFMPPTPFYSADFLDRATALFRKAEALADNDAVRARVEKARLSLDYVKLCRAKRYSVRDGLYEPEDLDGLKSRFQDFVAAVKRFGISSLAERRNISQDEQGFAERMRPYRVATLENAALRLDVAPDLGGRVIRMIDKRTGADVMFHADSAVFSYPDNGGQLAWAYPDFHVRQPYDMKWSLDTEAAPGAIRLTGLADNGLRLTRTLQLRGDDPVLRTEATLENTGQAPLDVQLKANADFNPGGAPDPDLAIAFTSQKGDAVEKILMQPEQQPLGSEIYQSGERPNGEWRIVNRRLGLSLSNRFSNEQVERCVMNWSERGENRVTLSLWSPKRSLAHGESVRLDADYIVGSR